jgi:hypothetical protein
MKACRARGLDELPRHSEICLRMPNWLGDNVIALPIIRANWPAGCDDNIAVPECLCALAGVAGRCR